MELEDPGFGALRDTCPSLHFSFLLVEGTRSPPVLIRLKMAESLPGGGRNGEGSRDCRGGNGWKEGVWRDLSLWSEWLVSVLTHWLQPSSWGVGELLKTQPGPLPQIPTLRKQLCLPAPRVSGSTRSLPTSVRREARAK